MYEELMTFLQGYNAGILTAIAFQWIIRRRLEKKNRPPPQTPITHPLQLIEALRKAGIPFEIQQGGPDCQCPLCVAKRGSQPQRGGNDALH